MKTTLTILLLLTGWAMSAQNSFFPGELNAEDNSALERARDVHQQMVELTKAYAKPAGKLRVFPSYPVDEVRILTKDYSNKVARIYSPNGKLVQSLEIRRSIQLDVRNFPAGTYKVEVETAEGTYTGAFTCES